MRIQLHQYLLSGAESDRQWSTGKTGISEASRDVNNTRQGSRSQAQVQRSKVGQSGVTHRNNRYREERSEM